MMRVRISLLILLSVLLLLLPLGCNRNDDALYAQRLDASFFLVRATAPPFATSITRISSGSAQPNFEQQLGITRPTDVLVAGGFLYVANGTAPRIVKYNLSNNTVAGTFATPGVIGGMAAGDRFVLLLDAAQNNAYLMNQQWGIAGFVTVPLAFTPVLATYNADRFYITGSSGQVVILNEIAVAAVASFNIGAGRVAQYAAVNNGKQPVVYWRRTPTEPLYLTSIDANGNYLRDTARTVFAKVQLTPFGRSEFGTEWLANVNQTGNTLNIPALRDTVRTFEMDFRTGVLFYHSRDTLFRFNVAAARREAAWPLPATIIKAAHSYVRN
jgi:hypothetical protein